MLLFPILMACKGLIAAQAAAAAVSVLGAVETLTMLPESRGRSLEELSPEAFEPARASGLSRRPGRGRGSSDDADSLPVRSQARFRKQKRKKAG